MPRPPLLHTGAFDTVEAADRVLARLGKVLVSRLLIVQRLGDGDHVAAGVLTRELLGVNRTPGFARSAVRAANKASANATGKKEKGDKGGAKVEKSGGSKKFRRGGGEPSVIPPHLQSIDLPPFQKASSLLPHPLHHLIPKNSSLNPTSQNITTLALRRPPRKRSGRGRPRKVSTLDVSEMEGLVLGTRRRLAAALATSAPWSLLSGALWNSGLCGAGGRGRFWATAAILWLTQLLEREDLIESSAYQFKTFGGGPLATTLLWPLPTSSTTSNDPFSRTAPSAPANKLHRCFHSSFNR